MAAPSEKPAIALASAPDKIEGNVTVVTVPGGELRVAVVLGEYTITLKLQDALNLTKRIQDCCQTVIDASVNRALKAGLQ